MTDTMEVDAGAGPSAPPTATPAPAAKDGYELPWVRLGWGGRGRETVREKKGVMGVRRARAAPLPAPAARELTHALSPCLCVQGGRGALAPPGPGREDASVAVGPWWPGG